MNYDQSDQTIDLLKEIHRTLERMEEYLSHTQMDISSIRQSLDEQAKRIATLEESSNVGSLAAATNIDADVAEAARAAIETLDRRQEAESQSSACPATNENDTPIICPRCGKNILVPAEMGGLSFECPSCQATPQLTI